MNLAGKAIPIAVAGLVVLLMLPGDDTAGLFGSATGSAEAPVPAPAAVLMDGGADLADTTDTAPARPTYVALAPASTDTDPRDPTPVVGESQFGSLRPEVPSTAAPDAETATDETGPLDQPPDEMTTGSIGNDTAAGQPAFVGRQAVNMRVGPSTSTAIITTLRPGDRVSVLDRSGNWALVATADGDSGWVYGTYLGERPGATQTAQQEPPATRPTSNARAVRLTEATVHAGPSNGSERLFLLRPGERVRVVERRGNWARVVLRSGISGWVRVN